MCCIKDITVQGLFLFSWQGGVLMADRPTQEKLEQSVNDLKEEAAKPQRAEQERRQKQRRGTDRAVREAIEYAEALVDTVREPLVVLGGDLRIHSANRSFYQVFEVKPEETMGEFIYDLGNRQWDISKLRELLEEILPQNTRFDGFEVEHDFESIGKKVMLLNARRIERESEGRQLILLAIEDITYRKRAEEERENLVKELQDALASVKTLSGFLPICSSCKNIRDDEGYWSQIEAYIRDHSEAEFSHSICPECAKKLYPEHYEKSGSEIDKRQHSFDEQILKGFVGQD
jgi:PAS domain S-box-containing protein